MNSNSKRVWTYIIAIAIPLAVGGLSAALTSGKMSEYEQLVQPPLAPPSWVFPVVWTILFILMGISSAMIYESNSPGKSDALFIYGTQLVVNFFWTIFYFNFDARLLAFFWLVFLLMLVALMYSRFKPISKNAARLQIPYIIWLVFAGYLNLLTFLLNG